MSRLVERIEYWGQLLLLPIYWFSFLFPRNKRIWLFGSTFGRRFADNPRYFYLYISQMVKENSENLDKISSKEMEKFCYIDGKPIRPIWISQNCEIVNFLNSNGYEAYRYNSLKGRLMALRGRVYIYDNYTKDINFWLSGGAIKFNMWHGVPLKKIQHDNVFDVIRHPKNCWEAWKAFPRTLSDEKSSHYILTTSEFMKPIFSSAFRTKKVFTVGYPRIDGFAFGEIKKLYTPIEEKTICRIRKQLQAYENGKMIYYMPTFRESETVFFEKLHMTSFRQFLREQQIVFCTKLHPKSKLRKEFEKIDSDNFIVVDADADPYVFIEDSDALVTDYSSIYFDYLFAEKPIIFFNYDLQQYLKDTREMYFDYEEYTPGLKVENQEQLQKALIDVVEGRDCYMESRKNLQQKIYDETQRGISRDLLNRIKEIL